MSPTIQRPAVEVADRIHAELAPQRARLLRAGGIAERQSVLDLGAGHGLAIPELRRRAAGRVVALDRCPPPADVDVPWAVADATSMPFAAASFDLVFAQQIFLWIDDLDAVLAEIRRVLMPGGVLAALEPDFTGMIEQPAAIAIAEVWRAALIRAGARLDAGGALASAVGGARWRTEIQLAASIAPADPDRYARLDGLELRADERARLEAARRADHALPPGARVVHLPYVGVLATPP